MPRARKISKTAKAVLDKLTAELDGEEPHRKIGEPGGAYMPVCVERIGYSLYSVAHYFERNGDLVQDPDVVFWRSSEGEWYPVSVQHPFAPVQTAMFFDESGNPSGVKPVLQKDIATFVTMWMRNIKEQQSQYFKK